MNVSVFLYRVRRDRKGRSDRIADCQNWQDIDSENHINEVDLIETSVEEVDGRQKVDHGCFVCYCRCRVIRLLHNLEIKAHLHKWTHPRTKMFFT